MPLHCSAMVCMSMLNYAQFLFSRGLVFKWFPKVWASLACLNWTECSNAFPQVAWTRPLIHSSQKKITLLLFPQKKKNKKKRFGRKGCAFRSLPLPHAHLTTGGILFVRGSSSRCPHRDNCGWSGIKLGAGRLKSHHKLFTVDQDTREVQYGYCTRAVLFYLKELI